MLDTIRRHQQSWLTYLIFVALVVVFAVNFGPGSSSCRSGGGGTTYAAVVDGSYVRLQDFQRQYGQQVESLRRRAQAANYNLTERDLESIRQGVINSLVDARVVANEAKRLGLRISDDELRDYLEKAFQVSTMNPEEYRNFVARNFNTTTTRFEQDLRDELAAAKLQQLVADNVTVSDDELKAQFMREHDRAMIDYVRFDLSSVKLPEPSPAQISELEQKEPKAIEERYQVDQVRYRTPEERRGSMILVTLPKDASDADVARARSQLETLRDQIASGADFGAVAKAQSQDAATKAQGGDLGFHKRGELPAAIDRALFGLAPGEVTKEPVRTEQGLALVKLDEVKAPAERPLDQVRDQVAASILRERAADAQLAARADQLLSQLRSGKKLADLTVSKEDATKAKTDSAAAKAANLPVRQQSPWILASQEAIPGIGLAPELRKDVFALTKDAPVAPRTYKVGGAYYVVVLADRETPDLAKFASDEESLRSQALWTKRNEVVRDWTNHLRSQADVQLNPALFGSRESDEG